MTRSDSGSASGLATLFFLVLIGSASFLIMDVQHRAEGYHAIMDGRGVTGTVSVSRCEQHTLGDFCVGRFVSADGKTVKERVRINGADHAGIIRGAVLSGSGDVWTTTGRPWLRMTPVQVVAAAPVVLGLMILYGLLNGTRPGFLTRKVPSPAAREKEIRLGRVH
jgi:hypothetical protein